jgi:hypothetical protein
MEINALSRLSNLHNHFSLLRGADNSLLKANGYDAQLDEMAAVLADIQKLEHTYRQLSSLNGAMEMMLELLAAAHRKSLYGDHLHCLLEPLQDKLSRTVDELGGIL